MQSMDYFGVCASQFKTHKYFVYTNYKAFTVQNNSLNFNLFSPENTVLSKNKGISAKCNQKVQLCELKVITTALNLPTES